MDAGAFTSAWLPIEGEEDAFVAVEEPAFGERIRLALDEGEPVVVLGQGAFEYRFQRNPGE